MATRFAEAATARALVRYSQVWEDHRLVERALAITPDDDVLSIGSAGCNVLALLLDEPRRVTAIDLNPAQAALLELKLAAIAVLPYEGYVCFVGARDGADRLALYDRVRAHLSPSARAFWDPRSGELAAGVMHGGRFDRYLRGFQDHLAALVPAAAVTELVALDDRPRQRALFERFFDNDAVRARFDAYFGLTMQAHAGRDASQLRHVGPVDVTALLWKRFRYACTELSARDNFYLEYFLTGRYRDLDGGPPHLGRAAFARLRGLVDRVEIVVDELGRHLAAVPPGRYSKANLSDLFEYLSEDETEQLFAALARTLRPGGRLCYWNLFVPRTPASSSRTRLRAHSRTAEALWRLDRAFFYRAFHLEEVLP